MKLKSSQGARGTMLAAALALLAMACGQPSQTQAPVSKSGGPLYGGTAVFQGGGFHLDPHSSNTLFTFTLTSQVYNSLLQPKEGDFSLTDLDPGLAERWENSQDGKTWTFHLRKGVKWHDGSDFTSADVKASFNRVTNPPAGFVSPRKGQFEVIQRIDTPDDHTAIFQLKQPWADILYALSDAQMPILPGKLIESNPKFFEDNAMGTGPFKLTNYRKNDIAEFVRNEDYWDKGKPYLDGMTILYMPDAAQQFAALQTGQLTGPTEISPAARQTLQSPENKDKYVVQTPGVTTAGFINFGIHRQSPFSDVRVRRAINMALDRDSIDAFERAKCNSAGKGIMMQGTPYHLPDVDKMYFTQGTVQERRTAAKALLAEAGHPNGLTVDLKTRTSENYTNTALWVIDQLAAIDVRATMRPQETAQYYEYLESGNFDISMDLFASTFPTPDDLLFKYFAPEGAQNYNKYDNPRVTQLLRQQSQTIDRADRVKLTQEAERLIWDDVPMAQFCRLARPFAWHSYMQGYVRTISHYNSESMVNAWLDERYTGPRKAR